VAFVSDLGLTPIYTGKVRDLYEVDEQHLLMVASDRLSAFDVVMAEPIPRRAACSPHHELLDSRVRRRRAVISRQL